MKIGIMGGVFDPVHFGHLQAAEIVKEKLELEMVLFVPSGIPPHKPKPIANSKDRFKMLKLSLKNNKSFIPVNLEIKKGGYSYTIDTIREIKSIYGDKNDYYFIIGTDTIPELCKWKDIEKLFGMIKFVAVTREGFKIKVKSQKSKVKIASQNSKIELVEFPTLPVSSSLIRERIKKGLSIKYLLPDDVERYIQEKGLYFIKF
ncbi:MAG: nicotinate-nucleotide adenylyltransferase [bacterium]